MTPLIISYTRTAWLPATFFVMIALVAMAGASTAQAQGGNRAPMHIQKPRTGGIYRYSINLSPEEFSLDPATLYSADKARVINQIGDLLVDYDSAFTVQPELATRWEVSRNGLTYTYHLRRGVRFHDSPVFPNRKGRELKAADVKYCFDRLVDARVGVAFASYFVGKVKGAADYQKATREVLGTDKQPKVKGVSGFRVVDDYTFAIDLTAPYAPFKHVPALQGCIIYAREAVEHASADIGKNLVATGPFMVDSWPSDGELILRKNPEYWQKDMFGLQLPYLDSISIRSIPSMEKKVELVWKKELDEIQETSRDVVRAFMQDVKQNGGPAPIKVTFVTPLTTFFYGMLTTAGPFSDRRIRQAFNLAVDRGKLAKDVLKDPAAASARGIVPITMPGYPVDSIAGYGYDPVKAQGLMTEAGYGPGKPFPMVTLQVNLESDMQQRVAEAVAEMLKETLGVQVEIQTVTFPKHLELIESGEAPFFRLGWIGDYPDPETFLQTFYSKSPVGTNPTRYSSRKFDSLYTLALATLDDSKRMELYRQAEQVAVDDAPVLFLYHPLIRTVMRPTVRGLHLTPLNRPDMKFFWFDVEEGGLPDRSREQ